MEHSIRMISWWDKNNAIHLFPLTYHAILSDLVHSAMDVCQSSDDVINLPNDAVVLGYEGGDVEHKLIHSISGSIQEQTNAANCNSNIQVEQLMLQSYIMGLQ